MLPVRKRLLLDGWMPTLKYKGAATFAPGMAKRLPPAGPFAAAPIIQGKWDGTGVPDVVSFPRGAQMGNATGFCYSNIDPYQGTISFWITPEWAGNDGLSHYVVFPSSSLFLRKDTAGVLILYANGYNIIGPNVSAWTAGTTYHVVASWSSQRTIDGTNYGRVTVNNAHTYAGTTAPVPIIAPLSSLFLGSTGAATPANALIQGLTIYRRVLTDSNGYGDNVGQADEIGQIYA